MDSQRFDDLTSAIQSRRSVMRVFGAAALGALGLGVLASEESTARRKKRKGGKGNARCLKSGDLCETDGQCCGDNQICEVPTNASNSDTRCCGASGAVCGGVNEDGDAQPPFCCIGEAGRRSFICSENDLDNPGVKGTCIPAPDDGL